MSLFDNHRPYPGYIITCLEGVLEIGVYDDPAGGIERVLAAHHHPEFGTDITAIPASKITTDLTVEAVFECPVCYLRGTLTKGVWDTLAPGISPLVLTGHFMPDTHTAGEN